MVNDNEYYRQYRLKNKEKLKAYQQEWRDNNPDKVLASRDRNKKQRQDYNKKYYSTEIGKKKSRINKWKTRGVITDDWEKIYEWWDSSTECMFCAKHLIDNDKCLDHCHATGSPRAILCKHCNLNDLYAKSLTT